MDVLIRFLNALSRFVYVILVLLGIVFVGIIISTDYLDETLSELFSQNNVNENNNSVFVFTNETTEDSSNTDITFDTGQSNNVTDTNKCEEYRSLAEGVGFEGADLDIALQVMYYESSCNPNAVGDISLGYSYGLMQIHLPTWCTPNNQYPFGALQEAGIVYTCDDLFDPETNLTASYHILTNTDIGWNNWTTYRDIVSNPNKPYNFSVQSVNDNYEISEYLLDQNTLQECANKYYDMVKDAGFTGDEITTVLQLAILESGCDPDKIGEYSSIGILQISTDVWCQPNDWWSIGYLQEKLEITDCSNLSEPLISFRAARAISTDENGHQKGWNNWSNYVLVDRSLTIEQTDNTVVSSEPTVTESIEDISLYNDEITLVTSINNDEVLSMSVDSTNSSNVSQELLYTPMNSDMVNQSISSINDYTIPEQTYSNSVDAQNLKDEHISLCIEGFGYLAAKAEFYIPEDFLKLFEIALQRSGCNPLYNEDGYGLFAIESKWCMPDDRWVNGYLTHKGIAENCNELLTPDVSFRAAYHFIYETDSGWKNLE